MTPIHGKANCGWCGDRADGWVTAVGPYHQRMVPLCDTCLRVAEDYLDRGRQMILRLAGMEEQHGS